MKFLNVYLVWWAKIYIYIISYLLLFHRYFIDIYYFIDVHYFIDTLSQVIFNDKLILVWAQQMPKFNFHYLLFNYN